MRRAYVAGRRAAGERDMRGPFVVRSGRLGRDPTVARIAGHGICLATRPGTTTSLSRQRPDRGWCRLDRARSQGGHDRLSPCGQGVLRPPSVGGRCLACPMSTTVREEYEVGDLDPVGVLEAAAEAERTERRAAFRKLQLAAHWADLHPATTDTGVETFGGAGPAGRRVTRRRRHPGRGRVHPGTVRVGVGHVPVGRGTADRRRPRPAPPPPACCGSALVGSRCRPGRPAGSPVRPTACRRLPRSGSTNRSPTAAPAAP